FDDLADRLAFFIEPILLGTLGTPKSHSLSIPFIRVNQEEY
ncbi:MAG: hypothetical protein EZS28_021768, partial [Streblomastix strix]